MDLSIRVAGVEFSSHLRPSGEGFGIGPDGFDGWDDGVAVKADTVSRPSGHGDFDIPGFLEARIVSMSGTCVAKSPQKLAWFGAQLAGLLADGSGRVVVDRVGEVRWGTARIAPGSTTKFKVNGANPKHAAFQVQLKFADPRKYGGSRPFTPATSLSLIHYGNFLSLPVLEVTGSMPSGYSIAGPGGRLFTVAQALATGQTHRINMATGRLYRDGALQVGVVSRADMWGIPGGSLGVQYSLVPVSGAGLISAPGVLDTFI